MPQFRYLARSVDGKLVDGVVTSNDRSAAIRQVEQQRFVPIRIEAVPDKSSEGVAAAQKAERAVVRKAAESAKAAAHSMNSSGSAKPGAAKSKATNKASGADTS